MFHVCSAPAGAASFFAAASAGSASRFAGLHRRLLLFNASGVKNGHVQHEVKVGRDLRARRKTGKQTCIPRVRRARRSRPTQNTNPGLTRGLCLNDLLNLKR